MQLRKLNELRSAEVRLIKNLRVAFIDDYPQIRSLSAEDIEVIVVTNEPLIHSVKKDDLLYLKPLFIEEQLCEGADGIYSPDHLFNFIHKSEILIESIREFENLELPEDPNERLITKLLRYSASRNKAISPLASRKSKISYLFPLISMLSVEQNPLQHLTMMEDFTKKDFFAPQIIDRVNLCYECESNYLNFSETCVKCNSLDLKTENLVHHFRCAYIGPESDFNKKDQLICPKCDKTLKHIGIDYDKPSEIHTCNKCTHTTQETTMMAKCVDCGENNHLNQITSRDIKSYNPTEKGRLKALEGNKPSAEYNPSNEIDNSYLPFKIYELLKSHELQKKELYANLMYQIQITLHPEIHQSLKGVLIENLLAELISIIKPYLKKADIISVNTEKDIQLLAIDYTESQALELLSILRYNLNKMLCDNKQHESDPISVFLEKLSE